MVPPNKACFEYETYHEGEQKILKIQAANCPFPPSIEYSDLCMSKVIDLLLSVSGVTTITISQLREYEYDFSQTSLLVELAQLYRKLNKDERYSYSQIVIDPKHEQYIRGSYAQFQRLISRRLKEDPLAAYVELKRLERREKTKLENLLDQRHILSQQALVSILLDAIQKIEQLRIITLLLPHTKEYTLGQREIYGTLFHPTTRPDFMYTKLISEFPEGNLEESYEFRSGSDTSQANIFTFDDNIKILYHLTPPEFRFREEIYELLDDAKRILSEHKPTREEFVDPQRMREVFFNIGRDLLNDLMRQKGIKLSDEEIDQLAQALLRYTVGFGLIELLLADPKVQDVNINSPNGELPIFIVHQDYGDCYTNIYPTRLEVESWATKLRLISGRPLDEANPILDTELKVEGFTSRVAALTAPLNPSGLAFSFRRHRDYPWTLPLYLQPKIRMMNSLAAGLISFLIDQNATLLVAGTRSSGKTSLLGSFLVEIMRKSRVISIEDSVTGDMEILFKEKNKIKRVPIGDFVDRYMQKQKVRNSKSGHEVVDLQEKVEVYSLNKTGKMTWAKVSKLIRHKVQKVIYEVTTRTGRKIKVTGDHSLFTIKNIIIAPVEAKLLKKGDFLAVPRYLPNSNPPLSHINIIAGFSGGKGIMKGYLLDKRLIPLLQQRRQRLKTMGKRLYTRSTISRWIRTGTIPVMVLRALHLSPSSGSLFKVSSHSQALPVSLELDHDLLTFIGLWLADGCYDHSSVIMSVGSPEERELVTRIARRFNLRIKQHSDKFSLMIHSQTLKMIMKDFLQLQGNAYTKRVPSWVFTLSTEQIGWLLKGLFSGDGHAGKQEIIIALCSRKMLEDIQSLLLQFGIIARIGSQHKKDQTYAERISDLESWKRFKEHVNFLQQEKQARLQHLCAKTSTHNSTDLFPLSDFLRKELTGLKYYYYKNSRNNLGRTMLKRLLLLHPSWPSDKTARQNLKIFAQADIFWDQVREIKKLPTAEQYVYDLSVPGTENFIANNIIAHNTFELPQESMRALGYNIESLKVASALSAPGAEVDPSIGIRSTLRLGDSAIFVGEVRSKEAVALFEAMRVGAAANVVAGTIHADSPYGVYDRVVNDIGVPKTSFKAIDVIIIANPVISGLKKFKRVLRITEVRKEWDEDPLKEGAFVDLMVYNPLTDQLEVTDELKNGNSEILKRMAGRVKEFAGDWDAVWNNIQLRADAKQAIVDLFVENNDASILEADFVVKANDIFHLIADKIKDKKGHLDSSRILFEYKEWLRKEGKRKL